MSAYSEKKRQVENARQHFRMQLKDLTNTVDEKRQAVSKYADQMSLKKSFSDNFWLTAVGCVGAGLVMSKVFGSNSGSQHLSRRSVDRIAKEVSDRLEQRIATSVDGSPFHASGKPSLMKYAASRLFTSPSFATAVISTVVGAIGAKSGASLEEALSDDISDDERDVVKKADDSVQYH